MLYFFSNPQSSPDRYNVWKSSSFPLTHNKSLIFFTFFFPLSFPATWSCGFRCNILNNCYHLFLSECFPFQRWTSTHVVQSLFIHFGRNTERFISHSCFSFSPLAHPAASVLPHPLSSQSCSWGFLSDELYAWSSFWIIA